jgi:putative restriction endonuclease
MNEIRELAVRAALFEHLDRIVSQTSDETLEWEQTASFEFLGEKFSVRQTRGRGINKPVGLEGALSITTAFTPFGKRPPYEDLQGEDGYARYKYEGTNPDTHTNRSLRICMEFALPLAYFVGVRQAAYKAIYPIYVIGDRPDKLEFTLSDDRAEIGRDLSLLTPAERSCAMKATRVRLHQPIFREQILHAYTGACAVCHLKHAQLLDAAHIISDSKPRGEPEVPNGMALCKIHHAAYDRNFMGIQPDRKIVINSELLKEVDGPMLKYGLQEMHGSKIAIPRNPKARPDPDRLEERFSEFLAYERSGQ